MSDSEPRAHGQLTYTSSLTLGSLKKTPGCREENPESREENPGSRPYIEERTDVGEMDDDDQTNEAKEREEEERQGNVTWGRVDEDSFSILSSESPHDSELESQMIPDSEEEFQDVVRTLRHYRRGRKRRRRGGGGRRRARSPSVDSNCSCSSCGSSENSFFGTQEGPPGGEGTSYRRLYLWLGGAKYLLDPVIYGSMLITVLLTGAAIWASQKDKQKDQVAGKKMLKWTIPLMAVTSLIAFIWQAIWRLLIWKGYGKGDHIETRRNMIRVAQRNELIYTIRGAIYAPVGLKPCDGAVGEKKPKQMYEVVGWESEFDSETYFDSDLEPDGQYKRDLVPYREAEDSVSRDNRNIYTRRAWFRDVPIVWWDVWNKSTRYSGFMSKIGS